ncbi:MAG: diguanylate cyclase [Oligoflexus sp.]
MQKKSEASVQSAQDLFITGYRDLHKIFESPRSRIFRAIREHDGRQVILKILQEDFLERAEIARYKNQYQLLQEAPLSCTPEVLALEKFHNVPMLVFVDSGAPTLRQVLDNGRLSILECLDVAVKLASAVIEIHAQNIIHKDINPSNILYHPQEKFVNLIDFGISTKLLREQVSLDQDMVTEGSLPYMSPEQTGRMNRFLDYRSDLYSLGVTFYELFAGQLPFVSEDPLQLIHFHLAKKQVCLKDIDDQIPKVVSDIVDKLLNKDPERRYQSAWGLRADLQKCLESYQQSQSVKLFPLALQDVPDKFHIPETLYGRQKELSLLHSLVDRVSKGEQATVIISGSAGVGKSSLVRELQQTVNEYQGTFINGKFEEFHRNRPYSGLALAFGELVKHILSADEFELNHWRSEIIRILGSNAQIIIDWIPELELIIGPQQAVRELGPVETENRFRMVFLSFVRLITQQRSPLILYLDDLQWMDYPSAVLIELLIEEQNLKGLFLIGAYRSEELGATHSLQRLLRDLDDQHGIHTIHLQPLGLAEVSALIADALYTDPKRVRKLAELVIRKTGGNPFFTDEFLRSLHSEKHLYFDPQKGRWDWDLDSIQTLDLTDNIVQLMTNKIQKLENHTQELIQLAACIGHHFDAELLAKLSASSVQTVVAGLKTAVLEGLIIPIGDSYRLVELEVYRDGSDLEILYKFSHDRILQAARDLLELEKIAGIHYQVGQILKNRCYEYDREELIFSVVSHLNAAISCMQTEDERIELVRLNTQAAYRAKMSTAYDMAMELLLFVKSSLWKEQDWTNYYELALQLSNDLAETAGLIGDYETMNREVQLVLQRGKQLLDKIPVYETLVQAAIAQDDMLEAVRTGQAILRQLGVPTPKHPSNWRIIWEFLYTKIALWGKTQEDLLMLPELTDKLQLARIHFQYTLTQCIFLYMPKQVPVSICNALRTSLKYGNTSTSALVYTTYGIMLAGVLGRYEEGYKFGELGKKLYEKLQAKDVEAATLVSFNLYVRPWRDPLRSTLKDLQKAYQSGLESGDHEFAAHAAMGYCYRSFLAGVELHFLSQEIHDYQTALEKLEYRGNQYILGLYRQVVENLQKEPPSQPSVLAGPYYEEKSMINRHKEHKDAPGLFLTYFAKLQLSYYFAQYKEALQYALKGKQAFKAGMGTYNATVFYFFEGLTYLALDEWRNYRSEIKKIIKSFHVWAKNAPDNQMHKLCLLEAEWLRVKGKSYQAQKLYDKAMNMAKQSGFIQDEALIQELAANFHLKDDRPTMAIAYMRRARYTYERWGAMAKVRWLEEQYPQILNSLTGERPITSSLATMSSSTIDLTTLKKALLAIAEETIHSRMLEKIISSAIEFAGAQKGFLLLKKDNNFVIEAEGAIDQEAPKILQSIPFEQSQDLSVAVINYVKRTKKGIVIDNAQSVQQLIPGLENDPYIKSMGVRSLLCIPISLKSGNQADIVGLLYLENNQTGSAFTEEKIETLEIICLSAAGRLELSVKAATDGLTGLYNHEYFQSMLEKEILQSQRQLRNLSLIMIDIDHFKSFNDRWGHQVGDMVLKSVAEQIKLACRKSDIVARYGGEELIVILPETSCDMAYHVAERIRQSVEQHSLQHGENQLKVTVSLGVSYLQETVRTARALIERADEALYLSKNNGRNKVTMI